MDCPEKYIPPADYKEKFSLMKNLPDKESFKFFDLPDIVQFKILREYLSTLNKSCLFNVAKFLPLLNCYESWLSNNQYFFSQILIPFTSFDNEFFLNWKKNVNYCYYICFDLKKLSIIMFTINNKLNFERYYFYNPTTYIRDKKLAASLISTQEYLNSFLNIFSPCKAYKVNLKEYFFVNFSLKLIRWIDGCIHPLENGEHVVRSIPLYKIVVEDNLTVKIVRAVGKWTGGLHNYKIVSEKLDSVCAPSPEDFSTQKVYEVDILTENEKEVLITQKMFDKVSYDEHSKRDYDLWDPFLTKNEKRLHFMDPSSLPFMYQINANR